MNLLISHRRLLPRSCPFGRPSSSDVVWHKPIPIVNRIEVTKLKGLPGGLLEYTPGDQTRPSNIPWPDDVIQADLCKEMSEELGIAIRVNSLLRIDAIPLSSEKTKPFSIALLLPLCSAGRLRNLPCETEFRAHTIPLTRDQRYTFRSFD